MTSDIQRRVRFCLFAATLNFLTLALPKAEGMTFYALVSLGVLLNLVVMWLVLKGVKPLKSESEHLEAIAHAKRSIALLGSLLSLAFIASALAGVIDKQALPFLVFGYAFLLLLPMRIFGLAVERRMNEMENGG